MTIVLPSQMEGLLKEKAAREGLDAIADAIIAATLEWEARERAEAVEGVQRGLEDFAVGHYTTAADTFGEIRSRPE